MALTLICILGQLSTSPPALLVDRWGTEDGLPLRHVNDVAADGDGFIWVATYDGLARFDGRAFQVFRRSNTPTLRANRFHQVHLDRFGRLLAVAENGAVAQWTGTGFEYWTGLGPIREIERTGSVDWLLGREGLHRIEAHGPGPATPGIEGIVRSVVEDVSPGHLVGLQNGRIFRLTSAGAEPVLRVPDITELYSLARDQVGWVVSAREGVFRLAGQDAIPLRGSEHFERPCFLSGGLPGSRPLRVIADIRWYRITDQGLEPEGSGDCGTRPLRHGQNDWRVMAGHLWLGDTPVAIVPDGVRRMFEDAAGNLWLASTEGLLRARSPIASSTPGGGNLASVLASRDGTIYTAEWFGSVRRHRSDGRVEILQPHPDNRHGQGSWNNNQALAELRDGSVWIGSHAGVCQVSGHWCVELPNQPDAPRMKDVRAMLAEPKSVLLAAADGLYEAQKDEAGWRFDSVPGADAPDGRSLARLSDGTLLVSTITDGLVAIRDRQRHRFLEELPTRSPRGLTATTGGAWFGTDDAGFCRFSLTPGAPLASATISCIGEAAGLPNDAAHAVFEDDRLGRGGLRVDGDARLWVSTNRGLAITRLAEVRDVLAGDARVITPIVLTPSEGMPTLEANGQHQPSLSAAEDRVLIATQVGAAIIPRDLELPEPPQTWITSVKVGRVTVDSTRGVELGPNSAALRIEFAAPLLSFGSTLRFRTRLVGLDEAWSDASVETWREWNMLPPGRYTFEVQAGVAGAWGPTSRVAVDRIPAFTETAAFPALLAIGACLLVAGLMWNRGRQARRQRERLAQTVEIRTKELAEANSSLEQRTAELGESNAKLATRAEELLAIQQHRERLVAAVSHELRTPLSLIIGPLEDRLAERADPNLTLALRNAEHLTRLVDEMLQIAQIDAGARPLRVARRPLGDFVERATSRLSGGAERKDVTLHTQSDPGVVVYFDHELMEKVVANLVGNAIKFTPAGGRIDIRVFRRDGHAVLEVSDTAAVIEEVHRRLVFERFYQVAGSNDGGVPGTGIGLSLVREVAELHGGNVQVVPGDVGNVFTFSIPTGAEHISPDDITEGPGSIHTESTLETVGDNPTPAKDSEDSKPGLLLVEDHGEMRSFLTERLSRRWSVRAVANGAEALTCLADWTPAVVVSDLMMPVMDGLQLLREIRARPDLLELPVVIITARTSETSRRAGLELANDYITKPFNMIDAMDRIDRAAGVVRAAPPEPEETPDPTAAVDREFVSQLRTSIEAHLADEGFGVAELAQTLALSRRHLARRCRELLGTTPNDYMRRFRLEFAHDLLERGVYSTVSEVAYAVGITPSYFGRVFLAHYGQRPSDIIQQGRRG